jgi:mono/diheme cytochrome c family protein
MRRKFPTVEIYRQRCAVCHGANAQDAPNWRQQGPDGKFPPPPLDASGHAWHRPKAMLTQTIKAGTVKKGGGMPAWDGQLSDDDIEDVLAWIVSHWPDEVYRNWIATRDEPRRSTQAH